MSTIDAWQWIIQNWGCVSWTPIPQNIKALLGLHHAVGMCGGMLITKISADGAAEFIQRMNRKRG